MNQNILQDLASRAAVKEEGMIKRGIKPHVQFDQQILCQFNSVFLAAAICLPSLVQACLLK
jgi:hypothetical protein